MIKSKCNLKNGVVNLCGKFKRRQINLGIRGWHFTPKKVVHFFLLLKYVLISYAIKEFYKASPNIVKFPLTNTNFFSVYGKPIFSMALDRTFAKLNTTFYLYFALLSF
jgi:hypothetical protein